MIIKVKYVLTRWRPLIWLIWIRNSSNTCLAPFHQEITVPYDYVMKYKSLNRANVLVVFIQLLSSSWIFVCWSQCCSLCLVLSLQHIIQSHSSSLTSSSYQKCIFWYQSLLSLWFFCKKFVTWSSNFWDSFF